MTAQKARELVTSHDKMQKEFEGLMNQIEIYANRGFDNMLVKLTNNLFVERFKELGYKVEINETNNDAKITW